MRLMLDTNICIYIINARPPAVIERFGAFAMREVGISVITLAELEYGVAKSARPRRNREALKRFILPLEVTTFGTDATAAYGSARAALEKRGTPIGTMDLLIAAHAVSLGVTLVTNNTREFTKVPGLRVENWA